MPKMSHSPEPWRSANRNIPCDGIEECPVYDKDGKSVVDVAWYENGAENAERIVACVNFCRGLSSDYMIAATKLNPEEPVLACFGFLKRITTPCSTEPENNCSTCSNGSTPRT